MSHPRPKSRKVAWVVLGVVVALVLALITAFGSPLWLWFAYEPSVMTEVPIVFTGPACAGARDPSKETYERQVHKKRISWGPGAERHVEQVVCHACLHGSHESHAGSFLLRHQNGATTPLFDCACRQCRP